MDIVKKVIPAPSLAAKRALVKDASNYLLSRGNALHWNLTYKMILKLLL